MNPYAPPSARVDPSESPAMQDVLRVTFSNSFRDLLLFQIYVQLRSPVFLLLLFGMSGAIAFPAWAESDRSLNAALAVVMATLIVAAGLFLFQGVFVLIWMLVHRDRNFFRPRTLELSERSVTDVTEFTRYDVQWPAVQGVTRTPWCLYIRLTPTSSHCVPPRAFTDADAYARFADTAVALHRRAPREA